MQIRENTSLKPYNTFGIDVHSDHFVELSTDEEIIDFIKMHLEKYPEYFILGGGSNVLFTNDYHGLIIHLTNKGIKIIIEDDEHILLQVSAGEVWDDLVEYCVSHNYGGLENLSLIPGSVGASPIQNIGAYGVELKDHFKELRAINLESGDERIFSASDCAFGYRNSIFKNELRGQYLILDITLVLDKKPVFHTNYGIIPQELEAMKVDKLSIRAVREAVCNIRSRKLPDPKTLGNGGSFFKNPVISKVQYDVLKRKYPDLVSFPHDELHQKLAAGWLIEHAGWKGHRRGDAGVHQQQALVLVNYGNANGHDILDLSEEIQHSVFKMFDVTLEREINVI